MKIKKRILVLGDDLTFFQSAKDFMANSSTEVSYAMSVKEALNYLLSSEYCIVIICISLSVDSSIEFFRLVRETYLMPILVIAPKLRVSEKVALFHAGANACLERPVDAALCAAQARSLIQLYSDAKLADKKVHPLVFGTELIINPVYRHVIIDGEPSELTRTEFDLLYYMAEHPNQIFSRRQLYRQIWNDDLGISTRSVEEKIQIARDMTPRAQEIIQDAGRKIKKKDLVKLSRMEPEQQEQAAAQLAAGEIRSADEFPPAEPPKPSKPPEPAHEPERAAEPVTEPPASPTVPYSLGDKHYDTLEESIADLKNPDKDCSYTPDTLLADIDGFVQTFHKGFAWYHDPFCTIVFPHISKVQFEFVRQRFESISSAMADLLNQMERTINV